MQTGIARNLEPPVFNPVEIESVLLKQLAAVSQNQYAARRGISKSAVSKRKGEGHFAQIAEEIAALNLRIVPPEAVVVDGEYLRSLQTLARFYLESQVVAA